jgi:hypothetical protein
VSTARMERRKAYYYKCVENCFYQGRLWRRGEHVYKFNSMLSGPMSDNFELVDEKYEPMVPTDELAYDVVGDEKRFRPSAWE